jgi:VCBS repeat-containing protein
MAGAEAAARSADQIGNGRLGAEAAIRFRVAQATGVLALAHPESGEVVVFDADEFLRIDFRLILGESILLDQVGRTLRIVFADGAVIELLHFFDGGDSAPSTLVAQIDDATYLTPAFFFREYSSSSSSTNGRTNTQPVPSGSGGSSGDTQPINLPRQVTGIDDLPTPVVVGPFIPSVPELPALVVVFPDVAGPLPFPPEPPPVPPVSPNNSPEIIGAIDTGSVTEDVPTTTAGTIDFSDADVVNVHTVSVTPAAAGYVGTLTAHVSDPATGDGSGQVAWNFAVDAAALQFLAEGQQLTQTYTVAINDGAGGISSQDVTVTITGANDGPVVTAADRIGRVEEDISSTASGLIDFGDVDLTDAHTVTVTPPGPGYLGTFTANVTADSTGDGSGQVTWSFSIDNNLLRSFPEGQVITQTLRSRSTTDRAAPSRKTSPSSSRSSMIRRWRRTTPPRWPRAAQSRP